MASNSDEGSRGNDDSSEEESLATLKRKAYDNYELNDADDNDKRQRMDVESDEGPHPGIFVKVEVEELNYQDDDEAASRDVESPDPEPIKRRTRPSREKIDPDYVSDWRPPKRKKNTSCPDCGKVFENATEMKKHSIEHQVQTRHKCEVCGRCFSKAFGLKTHKRMHGEKNEHCPICDASFTLAINLNGSRPDETQKELLVGFLESNPDIVKGTDHAGPSKFVVAKKWTEAAVEINSSGVAKKDHKGWAKYWTEKKSFLKRLFTRGETSKLSGLNARLFALVRDEFTQNPMPFEPDHSDSENSDTEDEEATDRPERSPRDNATIEHDETSPKEAKKESNRSNKVFSPTVNVKASEIQLERLYQFMERNPGIAKGLLKTAQGRIETNRKWASVAKTLNSLDGAKKDSRGWAKFWTERKCFLKKLHARRKKSKLSALDARILSLLFDNADISQNQETSQYETYSQETVKEETASDDDSFAYELTSLPPKAFRRPSPLQMLRLVEFLECHPDIANCRTLSIQARLDTKAKWAFMAEEFNALGSVKKDGAGWSKFWSEKKFYLKKICAQHQTSRLSALEKRLVAIFDESNTTNSPQSTNAQQTRDESEDSLDTGETYDHQEGLVSGAHAPEDCSSDTYNKQESSKDKAVSDTHDVEGRCSEPSSLPRKAASRPNPSQMLRIVEFLESHPDIANCRTLSMQGRLETKAKWASVAVEFNALGTVKKDGPGWSKYWSEKKFYLKKICAQHQTLRLSEPEKRLVALIEESASNTQRYVHAQSDFTATDEFEGSVDTSIAEGSPVATNSAEVSERQMYALAEFLEHNQQLATGRTTTDDADHKWALFAQELNQIGDAIKDGRGWIKYWVGKKRYLKKVCAQNQISRLSNPELHLATLAGYTRQGGAEDKSHANEEEFSNLSAQSSSQLSVTDEENAPQTGDSRSTFKTILEELKQTFDPKYSRDDPASEVSAFVHSETSAKNVSPSRSDCDVATKSSQPTAAKDRRNGRPSLFQLEVLVEFLEKNPGVALCRFKSPAGRRHVDRKWGQITAQLSALPGACKDKNGWIKYWTEKKCYLKRLSLNHETARLSDLEKRLLNLINANPTQGNSQKEFPQTEDDTETPEPETIDLRKIEVEQSGIVSNSLRPGHKQMAALVDFLEQHPHIATTSARTSGERRHAAAKWAGVTTVLNQLGCAQKDRVGWNKYWVEKKCYLKKVCVQNQTSRLSDPEIRLAAIVGCLPQSAEALDTVQNADSIPSDSEDPEQTRKDRQVDNTPVELSEESLDDEELTHVEEATANNGLRPSGEQLHALVKFLAKNPRVASGCIRTSLGRTLVAKKWAELTRKINELGAAKKGWRAWVKYWVEKKFHLKKLCAKKKSPQLTDVEIRMAKIIGCLPQSMQDEAEDWNITSTEAKAARTGNDEVKTDEEDIEESSDAEKAPEKQNAVVSNSIRPGNRQMAALAEFFEQNPRLVTSSRTPTKRRQTAAKWNEVTIKLNQLGPAQRDRRGWTKYWVEKKCHLKKVCDQNHTSKLSDTDLRLVAILGSSSQATQDPADNTIVAPNENDDSRDPSPFSGGGEEYAERTQNEEDNTLLQATEESLEKMAGDQEGAILSSGIRPSKRQTNALLQFLEQNPRVARSCIRTSLARRGVTKKWAELTSKINKLGKVRKSPHGWIKYCAQKKSYLRKFCAQKEPSQLTATQLRMATILGCLPGATADEVDYKETMSLEEYNTDEEYDCEAKLDAEECSEGHRTEPNSLLQMATLVEFLEQYPHIATGCARTKEERSIDIAKWERVTAKLNQLGNVRKDRKGWKKWWISERAYLRNVVARRTKSQLSPNELRLVALLERNPELNSDNPLSSKANQQDASKRDRPSLKQLEALIEFLIKNPGVATFAFQGEVGERHLKRKWDEITAQLNALAGVQDDDQGWIKRWTDWNSHLRKVCEAKQAWTLSDLELRLVSALGYPTDKPRGSVDGRTSVTNKTTDFADHKTRCRLKAEKINRKARRRKIVVLKEEPFVRPELVLAEDPLRLSGFDGHLDTVVPCTETNPFQVDQDVVGTEQCPPGNDISDA